MRKLGDFIIGDDIKYTLTTESAATSGTISVKDGAGVEQITVQALSSVSTLVWSATILTTSSWAVGICKYKSKILTGTNDNYEEGYFLLEDNYT